MIKLLFCIITALLSISPLPAQVFSNGEAAGGMLSIPENYEARQLYREVILGSTRGIERLDKRVIEQMENNTPVMFRYIEEVDQEDGKEYSYLAFLNKEGRRYPGYGRGNFSIRKDKVSGTNLYITVLIRDDKDSYIRIYPFDDRSIMDLYLLGYPLYKRITLPLSFKKALFLSFEEIMKYTGSIVDWPMVLYSLFREEDEALNSVAAKIRKLLPDLDFKEDGVFNELGELVHISDGSSQGAAGGLNCSGFSKWVVDGFFFSMENRFIAPESLKLRLKEYRGTRLSNRFESKRDPFFGLDWTRNLAVHLYEAEYDRKVTDPEIFDVREDSYFKYIEDMGYPVESLEMLLFCLASDNPGAFYLGSVNGQFGKEPVIRQHFHILVFFPYFTREGLFKVVVMESCNETGIEALLERYQKNEYIHLVKVETMLEFGL